MPLNLLKTAESRRGVDPSASFPSATRTTPNVRPPYKVLRESILPGGAGASSFAFDLMLLNKNISAVVASLPVGSSASWRQCRWPHDSSRPSVQCASAAKRSPGLPRLAHSLSSLHANSRSISSCMTLTTCADGSRCNWLLKLTHCLFDRHLHFQICTSRENTTADSPSCALPTKRRHRQLCASQRRCHNTHAPKRARPQPNSS